MLKKMGGFFWLLGATFSLAITSASAGTPVTQPWPWNEPSLANAQQMYVDGYEPTVLSDFAAADKVFRSLRPRTDFTSKFLFIPGAQCYQRAMVWSYDMAQTGIQSLKVVLWYSGWYYDWYKKEKTTFGNAAWVFHIAPVVQVGADKELYVLDHGFDSIRGPMKLQAWARTFLDAPYVGDCRIIKTAKEYHQLKDRIPEPCMLQIVPMHYYSPMLFSDLEDKGTIIRSFQKNDLDDAWKGLKNP